MPDTGSEAEAAVVAWLKRPGDLVEAEEPICLVAWNELTAEVTSPASGVVRMLALASGHHAPTGASLAVIDTSVLAPQRVPDPVADPGQVPRELLREAPIAEPKPVDLSEVQAPTGAPFSVIETSVLAGHPEPVSEPEPASEPEPDLEPVDDSWNGPAALLRDAPVDDSEPVDLGDFLSPAVRRFADERGVDPSSVDGTGRDGRVTLRDLTS
jgi:pyruvate/2-oxoglutarate dehydrogenase complex dihydrolipoamide acyltransferase (E2) component